VQQISAYKCVLVESGSLGITISWHTEASKNSLFKFKVYSVVSDYARINYTYTKRLISIKLARNVFESFQTLHGIWKNKVKI
jgi:hypothetical protein